MANLVLAQLDSALWSRLAYPSKTRSGGSTVLPDDISTEPHHITPAAQEQLTRVSYELTQGLSQGAIGGIPLRHYFRGSLSNIYGERHNAGQRAVAEYLRSGFALGVDMLGLGRGRSLIEAFGDFLLHEFSRHDDERRITETELLGGLLKTLTRHPEPGFLIAHPNVFRTGSSSWAAYTDHDQPALRGQQDLPTSPVAFASYGGRYFSGRVSPPILGALIQAGSNPPAWVSALDSQAMRSAAVALRKKGLLP